MAAKLEWPIREEYYIATRYFIGDRGKLYLVSKFAIDGVVKFQAWCRHKRRPKKSEHNTIRIPKGSDYFDNGLLGIYGTEDEAKTACQDYENKRALGRYDRTAKH